MQRSYDNDIRRVPRREGRSQYPVNDDRIDLNTSFSGQSADPPELVATLQALKNPDKNIRLAAVMKLEQIGIESAKSIPALVTVLGDSDKVVAASAVSVLSKLGRIPVPRLVNALEDPSTQVREYAAWTLEKIGSNARGAAPALAEVVANCDEDENVREAASLALSCIGNESIPLLRNLLREYAPTVREYALRTVARMGRAGMQVIPEICILLTDNDTGVKRAAQHTVIRIGADSLSAILKCVHDSKLSLLDAKWLVRQMGSQAVKVLSDEIQTSSSRSQVRICIELAGHLGPLADKVTPALIRLVKSRLTDAETSTQAMEALEKIDPEAKRKLDRTSFFRSIKHAIANFFRPCN